MEWIHCPVNNVQAYIEYNDFNYKFYPVDDNDNRAT
jgi:hypothetical protein